MTTVRDIGLWRRVAHAVRPVGGVIRALGAGRLIALVLLVGVVYLRAVDPTPMTMARYQVFDLMQRLDPREAFTDRVAIIDIDESSIEALGQWPWSRDRIAELVDRLNAAGAVSIGFDIVFSEPDRLSPSAFAEGAEGLPPMVRGLLAGMPSTDEAFAEAIGRAPVVLGMGSSVEVLDDVEGADALSPTTLPAVASMVEYGGDPRAHLFGFPDLLRNIPAIERTASGIGLFTLVPEHDGVVRRVPAAVRIGDRLVPPLSLEMVRVAVGAQYHAVHLNPQGAGVDAVRVHEFKVPTDRNGRIWVHYAEHDPTLYVSANDVVGASFDEAALRERIDGKFVLIGTSAIGLKDLRITPLNDTIPGVEVHAQLIDSVLGHRHLTRPPYALGLEYVVAIAAALLLIVVAPRMSASRSLPVFAGVLVVFWGGAFLAFSSGAVVLDATFPTLAVVLVFGAMAYSAYSQAEAQKRQIRTAFSQYLAPAMVQRLAEDPDSLKLGGENREMTFLFCDIAGFTSFVEQAEPEDLVRLLNEYLDGVCQIVMNHGGAIDKIVGDAVHAMFNAPVDDPEHAANAVRAALEIETFVNDFRARKQAEGFNFGKTRIGVNTGRVVIGNFGGASRFDYTAHGDAINTAARLEGVNKHLGTTICVAGTTRKLCPEMPFRPIGALYLKGKEEPTDAFSPVREEAISSPVVTRYAEAYDRLDARDPSVSEAFDALSKDFPDDPLVALHAARLRAGGQGVDIRMTEK